IFPGLSVLENVLVPLTLRDGEGMGFLRAHHRAPERVDEARGILERVGLAAEAGRRASELPYGDKRRIEIALVLALRPKLVLLDEPTAGMTPEETEQMVGLIRQLAEESSVTFFLTEHDMKVVFSVADYIYVLHQGSLLAEGAPGEIRTDPRVREAYLGGSLDS
ncbi:MAG: ABC transporter ATP-binding protein, partial [Candidatus Dadabacteria bacterium]